jgi:hypothetical protein
MRRQFFTYSRKWIWFHPASWMNLSTFHGKKRMYEWWSMPGWRRRSEVAAWAENNQKSGVVTIRKGHEFKDLDYPDEEEEIEKMEDAKENFILCLRKDIILKTSSSLIILPQNK